MRPRSGLAMAPSPSRARSIPSFLALAGTLLLGSCALWRPTTVPLRTVAAPAACNTQPDTLIVLLPGSWSLPEDFEREGFVSAVRERQLAVDLLLVDAHVGYYRDRVIVERLRADVIEPARARGYRHIWLAGISIGGFGSLIYADAFPGDIDGVIALAPFLGSPEIARTVAAAGGLAAWRPPPPSPLPAAAPSDEVDLRLWGALHERTAPGSLPEQPLFLGYGLADRFVVNDGLLAAALPRSRVFTAEGGHDWPVWKVLWQRMLPALPWPFDPSCRPH